jgi:serine/threonine protein phosphatase 1
MTDKITKYHHHYEANTKGKDYIIGDLHGMYSPLMDALDKLKFDKSVDRLFSVGDVIDRGPNSLDCAKLVYEPWFYMTIGNHEQLMMFTLLNNCRSSYQTWMSNGGTWHLTEDEQQLYELADRFQTLPLIISVGEGKDRFNIVHAEVLKHSSDYSKFVCDDDIDNWNFNTREIEDMTWGREMITMRSSRYSHLLQELKDPSTKLQSDKLSTTYCGHSGVTQHPCKIEQQIFLDTSFSYSSIAREPEKFPLTIACPQDNCYYLYTNPWKTLIHYDNQNIKIYK